MTGGTVVWITGLPGSGKSTLAASFAASARGSGMPCVVLDGDEVRAILGRPAGRGEADRDAFYDSLARLAAHLARQGLVVVVAATANRTAHREHARALAPRYVEVYVATAAAECERRDPKGLYAAARAGLAAGVPGIDAPYDPPAAPDVTASGGEDENAIERILATVCSDAGSTTPAADDPRQCSGCGRSRNT